MQALNAHRKATVASEKLQVTVAQLQKQLTEALGQLEERRKIATAGLYYFQRCKGSNVELPSKVEFCTLSRRKVPEAVSDSMGDAVALPWIHRCLLWLALRLA